MYCSEKALTNIAPSEEVKVCRGASARFFKSKNIKKPFPFSKGKEDDTYKNYQIFYPSRRLLYIRLLS